MADCAQNQITRGTTPTNEFSVSIDLRAATVYAWYSQNDKLLITKNSFEGGIVVEENLLKVKLTQAETLMFSQKSKDSMIAIQFGYVLADGTADRSNIIYTTVGKILEDVEMEYVPINV